MHGHGTPNRDKSSFLHDLPDILEVSLTHAQQVAGGDVYQAILLNQKLALCSLHARRRVGVGGWVGGVVGVAEWCVGGWVGGCERLWMGDVHRQACARLSASSAHALALVNSLLAAKLAAVPEPIRGHCDQLQHARIQKVATDAMKPRACLATTSAASTTPTACSGCLSGGRCTRIPPYSRALK
jgi:hypothetical protein